MVVERYPNAAGDNSAAATSSYDEGDRKYPSNALSQSTRSSGSSFHAVHPLAGSPNVPQQFPSAGVPLSGDSTTGTPSDTRTSYTVEPVVHGARHGDFQHVSKATTTISSEDPFHTEGVPKALAERLEAKTDYEKSHQLTSFFQLYCLTMMSCYYGILVSLYIMYTIPAEAMRLAKSWESAFVVCERVMYGAAHLLAPIFGRLSDRTVSQWGRRRPWLILGVLLQVVAQTWLFFSSRGMNVPGFFLAMALSLVAKNMVLPMISALYADVVPETHKSTVSSISSFQGALGAVLGFSYQCAFPHWPIYYCYSVSLLAFVVCVGVTFSILDEPAHYNERPGANRVNMDYYLNTIFLPCIKIKRAVFPSKFETVRDVDSQNTSKSVSPSDLSSTATETEADTLLHARQQTPMKDIRDENHGSSEKNENPDGTHRTGNLPGSEHSGGDTKYPTRKTKKLNISSRSNLSGSLCRTGGTSYSGALPEKVKLRSPGPKYGTVRGNEIALDSVVGDNTPDDVGQNLIGDFLDLEKQPSLFVSPFEGGTDFSLQNFSRMFGYAAQAGLSLTLFILRDVIRMPDKDLGVRQMSLLSLFGQAIIAIVGTLLGVFVTRIKTSFHLWTIGLVAAVILWSIYLVSIGWMIGDGEDPVSLAKHDKEHHVETAKNRDYSSEFYAQYSIIAYIVSFLYGMAAALVGVCGMTVTLNTIPATMGSGAAMGMFGPTITYGFVFGSISVGLALSPFQFTDEERTHLFGEADKPEEPLDSAGNILVPSASSSANQHHHYSADSDWRPNYKPQAYQFMCGLSILYAIIALILQLKINLNRLWARSESGMKGMVMDAAS